ncbi:MAG: C40 family peptidase [Armatimonadota bacterium]
MKYRKRIVVSLFLALLALSPMAALCEPIAEQPPIVPIDNPLIDGQNIELTLKLEPAKPEVKPKVETEKPAPKVVKKPSFIERVITASRSLIKRAVDWLGTRYVWGGASRKGIDCSGLTQQLYAKEGIKLPHNAKAQYKLGNPVSKSALLPGDLVFFNTRGPLTHVGLYIGNNKFLHAANKKRGVRIDRLDSKYYQKRYAGARRYKDFGSIG